MSLPAFDSRFVVDGDVRPDILVCMMRQQLLARGELCCVCTQGGHEERCASWFPKQLASKQALSQHVLHVETCIYSALKERKPGNAKLSVLQMVT